MEITISLILGSYFATKVNWTFNFGIGILSNCKKYELKEMEKLFLINLNDL